MTVLVRASLGYYYHGLAWGFSLGGCRVLSGVMGKTPDSELEVLDLKPWDSTALKS